MHTPLYDIAAAVVVIGIVVGVIGIAPIAIVVGTDEASGKEMAAVVEAMVEAVMSETTGVTRSEAVTLEAVTANGSKPDIAGWRMRKTVTKIAAANASSGETTAAKTTGVRGEAATAETSATESAGMATAETTTTAEATSTVATATSTAVTATKG